MYDLWDSRSGAWISSWNSEVNMAIDILTRIVVNHDTDLEMFGPGFSEKLRDERLVRWANAVVALKCVEGKI